MRVTDERSSLDLLMDGSPQMGSRQQPSWHVDAVRGAVHPITVILTEKTDVPGPMVVRCQTSTRSLLGEEVERRTRGLRLRQRLQCGEGASTGLLSSVRRHGGHERHDG